MKGTIAKQIQSDGYTHINVVDSNNKTMTYSSPTDRTFSDCWWLYVVWKE